MPACADTRTLLHLVMRWNPVLDPWNRCGISHHPLLITSCSVTRIIHCVLQSSMSSTMKRFTGNNPWSTLDCFRRNYNMLTVCIIRAYILKVRSVSYWDHIEHLFFTLSAGGFSLDVRIWRLWTFRFWRLKTVPALKELQFYSGRRPIT